MQPALFRNEKPLVQIDLSNGPAVHWSNYAKIHLDMDVLFPCLTYNYYGTNPRHCIGPDNWNMALISGINDQIRRNKRDNTRSWLVISAENASNPKIKEMLSDTEKCSIFLGKLLSKLNHKVDFIQIYEFEDGHKPWEINWKYRWRKDRIWERMNAYKEVIEKSDFKDVRIVFTMEADISPRYWIPFLNDIQVNKMAPNVAFNFTNTKGNVRKINQISYRQDRMSSSDVPILLNYTHEEASLVEVAQILIGAARAESVGMVHWEKPPVGFNGRPDSVHMGLFNLNRLLSSTLELDRSANQVIEDDFTSNSFMIGKNGDGEYFMLLSNPRRSKYHLKLHYLPREKLYHVDYMRGDDDGDGYRVFESKEIWHFDEVMDLTIDVPHNSVLGLRLNTVKLNGPS